jgi:hypothetical protein
LALPRSPFMANFRIAHNSAGAATRENIRKPADLICRP